MSNIDVETLDLGDWPVAQEYLVEVGRIALVWSRLKTFVCNSVANLAGLENLEDPRMYSVFTARSYGDNLDLLERLCFQQIDQSPNLTGYEAVMRKLRQAQIDKEFYLGGSMKPNPVNDEVEMTVLVDQISNQTTTVKLELNELKAAVLKIDDAQHELYKLVCGLERPGREV